MVHACIVAQSDSATPWTVASQAPLSMGFSRQEYWSWVPLPSPRRDYPGFKWTLLSEKKKKAQPKS